MNAFCIPKVRRKIVGLFLLPFKRHYFDIIGNIFEIFYDIIQINLQVKRKEGYCGFSKYNSKCTRLH